MFAAIALAAGLALKASDIQSIDVVMSAYMRTFADIRIARRGSTFVRPDGTTVAPGVIDALVDAMNSPNESLPVRYDLKQLREALDRGRDEYGACEGFDDVGVFEKVIDERYYAGWRQPTDYTTQVYALITTSDKRIQIYSRPLRPLGLPFVIHAVGLNRDIEDYDARMAFAIDALVPHSNISKLALVDRAVDDFGRYKCGVP